MLTRYIFIFFAFTLIFILIFLPFFSIHNQENWLILYPALKIIIIIITAILFLFQFFVLFVFFHNFVCCIYLFDFSCQNLLFVFLLPQQQPPIYLFIFHFKEPLFFDIFFNTYNNIFYTFACAKCRGHSIERSFIMLLFIVLLSSRCCLWFWIALVYLQKNIITTKKKSCQRFAHKYDFCLFEFILIILVLGLSNDDNSSYIWIRELLNFLNNLSLVSEYPGRGSYRLKSKSLPNSYNQL